MSLWVFLTSSKMRLYTVCSAVKAPRLDMCYTLIAGPDRAMQHVFLCINCTFIDVWMHSRMHATYIYIDISTKSFMKRARIGYSSVSYKILASTLQKIIGQAPPRAFL